MATPAMAIKPIEIIFFMCFTLIIRNSSKSLLLPVFVIYLTSHMKTTPKTHISPNAKIIMDRRLPIRTYTLNVRLQYTHDLQRKILNVRHVGNTGHRSKSLRYFRRRAGNRPELTVPGAASERGKCRIKRHSNTSENGPEGP